MGNSASRKHSKMPKPSIEKPSNYQSSSSGDFANSAPPPYSMPEPSPQMPTPQQPAQVPGESTSSTSGHGNTWLREPMRQGTIENVLETLRKYSTVIVVDDSGSMLGSRWREARNALSSLAGTAAEYDTDGIDIYFINDKRTGHNYKDPQAVERLFDSVRPCGITPIGEKLEELLLEYLDSLENAKKRADPKAWKDIKPINYVVITDGAPTDDPESVIVAAARRLDNGNFPITQVGIQFVQIGDSQDATKYLKELDDGLSASHGIRDMVDTTPYLGTALTADMLVKILIGGINRRVDRKS